MRRRRRCPVCHGLDARTQTPTTTATRRTHTHTVPRLTRRAQSLAARLSAADGSVAARLRTLWFQVQSSAEVAARAGEWRSACGVRAARARFLQTPTAPPAASPPWASAATRPNPRADTHHIRRRALRAKARARMVAHAQGPAAASPARPARPLRRTHLHCRPTRRHSLLADAAGVAAATPPGGRPVEHLNELLGASGQPGSAARGWEGGEMWCAVARAATPACEWSANVGDPRRAERKRLPAAAPVRPP